MSKLGFLCIFLVMFFAVSSCVSHSDATEIETRKETVAAGELIRQSDVLYSQRENLDKLREGIALLRRARSSEPQNFEAWWKLAQANYFLGKNSPDDTESEKAFKEGIGAAKRAMQIAPEKPDGYFWTGANLGGEAQRNTLSGITSVSEIREMMQKVIEIQPDHQGASAYDALAQVELGTRLTGGSTEKAIEYLQKGLALNKENAYLHLHLAEAYLALDRDGEARKQIDAVLKMKPPEEYLPEYNDAARQAQKLLKTKF